MKASMLCLALLAGSVAAHAADDVNNMPFNAVLEKKDVAVKVTAAALSEIGDSGGDINGVNGITSDFQGQSLPLFALFAPSVKEGEWEPLLLRQGRIEGTLQCARVRVGTAPQIPQIKKGVLAQDCIIKKLQ